MINIDSNTIVSIVGPTATGKTSTSLQLIKSLQKQKKFIGFDIISADSRQVYKCLQITSGADIPENFVFDKNKKCWRNKDIRIYLVAVLDQDQEWSLAHFLQMAREVIVNSIENNRLPLVVGGAGLYHQHLLNFDSTINIPPNEEVRERAEKMELSQLQDWAKLLDSEKYTYLNNSDRHNSRRLIRIIEKAIYQPILSRDQKNQYQQYFDGLKHQVFGLKLDLDTTQEKITKRVQIRIKQGAIEEVKKIDTGNPSILTALGVAEIRSFLQGEIDLKGLKDLWSLHEFQYAKRQLTWWRKNCQVKWL